MVSLLDKVQSQLVSGSVAAGQTTITPSSYIDTANFDGVLIGVVLGTINSGATVEVQVHGSNASTSGYGQMVDEEGRQVKVASADTDDNKIVWIDVVKPRNRYIKPIVVRGSADSAVASIVALKYNSRTTPVGQHTSTQAGSYIAISPVYNG